MKHLLLTTIAAVVLVGCGESQPPEPTTAKAPDIDIHDAARTGDIEVVKQYIATGADVDAKTALEKGTPLDQAASWGHKEIVELLIAKGADVNAKDKRGQTPLHFASSRGYKEIVELLIAKGADVNAKTSDGVTPLDIANHPDNTNKNKAEIENLLRKHGGKTGEELKAAGN